MQTPPTVFNNVSCPHCSGHKPKDGNRRKKAFKDQTRKLDALSCDAGANLPKNASCPLETRSTNAQDRGARPPSGRTTVRTQSIERIELRINESIADSSLARARSGTVLLQFAMRPTGNTRPATGKLHARAGIYESAATCHPQQKVLDCAAVIAVGMRCHLDATAVNGGLPATTDLSLVDETEDDNKRSLHCDEPREPTSDDNSQEDGAGVRSSTRLMQNMDDIDLTFGCSRLFSHTISR